MTIGKLAILLGDMPDKIAETYLAGKGYQVLHINDIQQVNAYNQYLKEIDNKILERIEPMGGDVKLEKDKKN